MENTGLTKSAKQRIVNGATAALKNRQWFNGAGFNGDRLIIAYNYYPAFELREAKELISSFGVEYELVDIRTVMPNSQNDDIPSHMKR